MACKAKTQYVQFDKYAVLGLYVSMPDRSAKRVYLYS